MIHSIPTSSSSISSRILNVPRFLTNDFVILVSNESSINTTNCNFLGGLRLFSTETILTQCLEHARLILDLRTVDSGFNVWTSLAIERFHLMDSRWPWFTFLQLQQCSKIDLFVNLQSWCSYKSENNVPIEIVEAIACEGTLLEALNTYIVYKRKKAGVNDWFNLKILFLLPGMRNPQVLSKNFLSKEFVD